ncbi:hypothetical protein MAPG_06069 [Magnaporthiopsis poae ATCC 64411]|uniref:Uncharacterized protein n=1 Tax=Magnaporthiopsis poae (strain ATCC 64411 / 73-15) TaxID=644358 RepID=A0A0C4E126_MAGP6|nr:hypothetical protein MAPG_06069 [Magnaporthiopsis poae ATCC 64411]
MINKKGSARVCPRSFCETHPLDCPADIYADETSTEPDPEESNYPQWEISIDTVGSELALAGANVTALATVEERPLLFRRSGGKRSYSVYFADLVAGQIVIRILELLSRPYNGPTAQMRAGGPNVSQNGYRRNTVDCESNEIEQFDIRSTLRTTYTGYDMDHTLELQYLQDFAYAAINGRTLSDNAINNPIPFNEMEAYWMDGQRALPPPSRNITPWTRAKFDGLNSRLYEVIGSKTNRAPFRLLSRDLNNMKGRIFNMQYDSATGEKLGSPNPRADNYMRRQIDNTFDAATGSLEEAQGFLNALRDVVAVFRYLHDPDVLDAIQRTRWRLREQCQVAEDDVPRNSKGQSPLLGLTRIFEAFDDDY